MLKFAASPYIFSFTIDYMFSLNLYTLRNKIDSSQNELVLTSAWQQSKVEYCRTLAMLTFAWIAFIVCLDLFYDCINICTFLIAERGSTVWGTHSWRYSSISVTKASLSCKEKDQRTQLYIPGKDNICFLSAYIWLCQNGN